MTTFTECHGKVVERITLSNNDHESAVEVSFTDGTALAISLTPRIKVEASLDERRPPNGVVRKEYRAA